MKGNILEGKLHYWWDWSLMSKYNLANSNSAIQVIPAIQLLRRRAWFRIMTRNVAAKTELQCIESVHFRLTSEKLRSTLGLCCALYPVVHWTKSNVQIGYLVDQKAILWPTTDRPCRMHLLCKNWSGELFCQTMTWRDSVEFACVLSNLFHQILMSSRMDRSYRI